MLFDPPLPSPFYRVAIKFIVFDDKQRLLVIKTPETWEMPGGGWEHGESFEECIQRESHEELGVKVKTHSGILFTYRGPNPRNFVAVRLVVRVELASLDIHPTDPEVNEIKFVTKDELLSLSMQGDEAPIKECVDKIWTY